MKGKIIDFAIDHSRSMLLVMVTILVLGVVARLYIPKESEPRIEIPYFVITVSHDGISPEDAIRLLVRPVETQLKALDGVKAITATGAEHVAYIAVEFELTKDLDEAKLEVREAVDFAKAELPSTVDEPIISDTVNTDFPVLQINLLSERASERLMLHTARSLRDYLETTRGVQEITIQGHRDEVLEVTIEPAQLISHDITVERLTEALTRNNRLIAAGALASGKGSVSLKIPSVVDSTEDLLGLPLLTDGETVVTLSDVAAVHRTFKDRRNYVRVNGQDSVSLFVYRQSDSNSIDVADDIRQAVAHYEPRVPNNIELLITRDSSQFDAQQITELEGNIVTAILLVLAVVLPSIGLRSSMIVAAGIPVSFLFGLIFLWLFGFSFNFMVMFGMLMALGMLIDGSIIVTEEAERHIQTGLAGDRAYAAAAKRMFAPVTASTATTLAAFLPLLFWPGFAGEFLIYLPLTLFGVMCGSLLYTFVFVPSLGAILSRQTAEANDSAHDCVSPWDVELTTLTGISRWYATLISLAVRHTFFTLVVILLTVYGIFTLYNHRDLGVIFFNENDPVYSQAFVRARGNLDINEARSIVEEVEKIVLETEGVKELSTFVSSGFAMGEGQRQTYRAGSSNDVIGTIWIELHDASQRLRSGVEIIDGIRDETRKIGGIRVDLQPFEGRLYSSKPIFIQFAATEPSLLNPVVTAVRDFIETQVDGLRNLEDTLPLPGFEWQLDVDREKAGLFGVDVTAVGLAVQLITNGAKLGEYRPDDADEALDIRLRFSKESRGISSLDEIQLATDAGSVPISNFVTRRAVTRQDTIQRRDQLYIHAIQASLLPRVFANQKIDEIQAWIDEQAFDPRVSIQFIGLAEEQAKSIEFIGIALSFALLLMFILLATQFNSIYQAFVTIFAVVLSSSGVLLGLSITGAPFSAILSGLGIIALAGIVVNNNIVLIDTFNQGHKVRPDYDLVRLAALTGLQRFRPVVLTTLTTMIGFLPLASHQSIDLINRTWTSGGNLSGYWVPVAQAITFGLTFATILTLVVTPALLVLPDTVKQMKRRWLHQYRTNTSEVS